MGRFLCPKRFEDYHFHAGRSFLMSIQVEILPGRLVGRISYSFSWLGCHSQTKANIAVPIQVGRFSYHHQLVGAFHTHPDIKNFISIQVGSFSKPYRKGDSCIHTGAKILISVQLGSLDYPYKWEDCCIHYRLTNSHAHTGMKILTPYLRVARSSYPQRLAGSGSHTGRGAHGIPGIL